MSKKITSALISVFYKDGLEPLARELHNQGITIYSTGGTQNFIENLGIEVVPVEDLTTFPSILGGRVKTLHPSVFGGILGRRNHAQDVQEMKDFRIPIIDLVIVDLYPFQETVASTTDESLIIEKIDIGGPSMIRAAAKNFNDVTVVASKDDYSKLVDLLHDQAGSLTLDQRRNFAAKAFQIVADYDIAINNYFNKEKGSSRNLSPWSDPRGMHLVKHAVDQVRHVSLRAMRSGEQEPLGLALREHPAADLRRVSIRKWVRHFN